MLFGNSTMFKRTYGVRSVFFDGVFFVGIFLFLACSGSHFDRAALALDNVVHSKVVDILKVEVKRGKGKSSRSTINIQFNLHPRLPSGAKVEFELLYRGTPFEFMHYTLKDENRKNLKLMWKPKKRMPVDTFFLRTLLPLKIQNAKVAREIDKRSKDFPKNSQPWSWNYPKFPVEIGGKDAKEAESNRIKKYFTKQTDALLELNNEFIEEMEVLESGEKYVNNDVINKKKLAKFIDGWMKKFGELQLEILEYEKKEPGLFQKQRAAHFFLESLAKMIAKRCSRKQLKDTLSVYDTTIASLKLKGAKGFDPNYRHRVKVEDLKKMYEKVLNTVGIEIEEEEEDEEESEEDEEEKEE